MVEEDGKKTAVMIDLDKHGELWEDVYDSFLARQRKGEPRETLEQVRDHLRR